MASSSSLTIHVESIDAPRQPFVRPLEKTFLDEAIAPARAYAVSTNADFTAYLTRLSGRDVLLEGAMRLRLESACRRCLKTVPSEVPVSFMLNLVARPVPAQGKGRRGSKERPEDSGEGERDSSFEDREADEELFDGERIELAPILREQLLLALPGIEPVCREDCKGLCASCGGDLNEHNCGHSAKGPDPRWAALQNIKL